MDIKELKKISKKEMEVFVSSQEAVIFSLKQENDLLRQKVEGLEKIIIDGQTSITPEEIVCIEQIAVLKQHSSNRELSLDEIKRLDILIKNLRLIKDQSTTVIDHKDYRNVKEAELVAIARQFPDEEDQ